MRLLIEAHHPAHIHFFKNMVRLWRERGDAVLLLGRDRDVMRQLLSAYDWIPHEIVSATRKGNRFPLREMLARQAAVARSVVGFRPDLVLSLMGSYTQAARLLRVPSVIFTDSEFQSFNHRIAHPFATRIFTPRCFWKPLGPKQTRYPGYHELAFLHPKRFEPRREVLEPIAAKPGQYVVIRTSAWNTLHDIGESGLGPHFSRLMEAALARHSVFVVPEGGKLDPRWEPHRLRVAPHQFHDVLAFARLVISEGASTASEAACLGVPAVYVNTTRRGYLEDQQRRYGLVYNFTDPRAALDKSLELLEQPPDAGTLAEARRRLIEEHTDVTEYVVTELDRWMAERRAAGD